MEQRTYALGERYIGAGKRTGKIELYEVPGNALGTYLDGAEIVLHANAQDATGDTMNAGEITIYGSTGDAAGYAMRGGSIYVQGDAGYRAGIHMKAYEDKIPVLVIGGRAGSFLGEYQAGGVIVVLGIGSEDRQPVGNFCGTGMHGGRIFLRTEHLPKDLPQQVIAEKGERAGYGNRRAADPPLLRKNSAQTPRRCSATPTYAASNSKRTHTSSCM